MCLVDEMSSQGSWLFRWRSFVPLVLLGIMLPPSLAHMRMPFGSHEFHRIWEFTCLGISLLGLAIRCATVGFVPIGTSGRGTTRLRANSINTTGLYSLVRHPIYLGNYLVGLGVTLVWFDWWAPVIYSLCFWLYYERIILVEERFLRSKYPAEFDYWASKTPAFIPTFSPLERWTAPSLPFSLVSMVRREYSTLVLIIVLHAGMEIIENYWLDRRFTFGLLWGAMLSVTLALYLMLGLMKKHTRWLEASGR